MIPVREYNGTHIYVVWCILGTVDDHWAKESSGILGTIVRVIPRCTVEVCFKRVGERLSGSNWALLNGWDAIEPRGLSLEDAMPVQSSTFFWASDLIMHGDLESVTPVGL